MLAYFLLRLLSVHCHILLLLLFYFYFDLHSIYLRLLRMYSYLTYVYFDIYLHIYLQHKAKMFTELESELGNKDEEGAMNLI